eukprot:7389864-Prymnesium_polylepis.1
MESSAWTQYVRRLFEKLTGTAIAPKTLRSIFITWLKENTDCPEILKAAAHAMKHQQATQESAHYDANADTKLVKAAYDFNLAYASTFTGDGAVAISSSSDVVIAPDQITVLPTVLAVEPEPEAEPEPAAAPNVDTHVLPQIAVSELMGRLASIGFTRSSARGNGDCYPMSVMAGFEISATAAKQPTAATTEAVRGVREGAVGILAGEAAVDGIDAVVFRAGERLPEDAGAARTAMADWREPGFWSSAGANGNRSSSFHLGVALHLERPVAVLERRGKVYNDPARIYGAREDGALYHSPAKPGAPETVPTYKLVPVADLLEMLRARPAAQSLIEFNGMNHFIPWLAPKPLPAAAGGSSAEAAAEPEPEKEPSIAATEPADDLGDMDEAEPAASVEETADIEGVAEAVPDAAPRRSGRAAKMPRLSFPVPSSLGVVSSGRDVDDSDAFDVTGIA